MSKPETANAPPNNPDGARRFAASLMLVLAAAGTGAAAMGVTAGRGLPWQFFAFPTVLYGLGALGFARRDVLSQVLARGGVAAFAGPALLTVASKLASAGRVDVPLLVVGATGALAIVAAQPVLYTREAKAAFAPSRFRNTWITSSTLATATAAILGVVAVLETGHPLTSVLVALQAVLLCLSVAGVIRMRGWGIALAAANAAFGTTLAIAAGAQLVPRVLELSMVPVLASMGLVLPLLLARLLPAPTAREPATTSTGLRAATMARVHVEETFEAAESLDSRDSHSDVADPRMRAHM